MTTTPKAPALAPLRWTPLTALAPRFAANVAALAIRHPDLASSLRSLAPATIYQIAAHASGIALGASTGPDVQPLPCTMPAERAAATVASLCPTGAFTEPVLVAGEDQGWLWDQLYRLPCRSHAGHRPPVYLLVADLERLWVILHVQDWRTLLADPRVRLFAGPDAAEQLGTAFTGNWAINWPKRWVTVDPTVWPANVTFDGLQVAAVNERARVMASLTAPAAPADAAAVVARHTTGRPLRVLGFTSRYTTFLQHSMRDWLAAFAALGHDTRLVIESADHETSCPLIDAAACRDFRPDLIVVIDHHRAEIPGLPAHVPVVMWVQDRMPSIYRPEAGAAQGPLDYAIGYGRLELSRSFGYPASRFRPAMVGVNEARFGADPMSPAELDPFRCDASFVSHATEPAERILAQVQRGVIEPALRRAIDDVFQQLRATYDAGGSVDSGILLRHRIERALLDHAAVSAANAANLLDVFQHRINNALFRHQSIRWLAETGIDLRLYGRGWERHPEFARHARGVADNERQLRAIYQASTINLQVTPFGAVHQRLLDGLAAGGFFLLRSTHADAEEAIRRQMWDWSRRVGATSGRAMLAAEDNELAELRRRYAAFGAVDLGTDPDYVYAALEECAATGFTRFASTLFADAGPVSFATREALQAKVRHFLGAPDERQAIVRSMRQRVLETHTYTAITRGLLSMIADDLRGRPMAATA